MRWKNTGYLTSRTEFCGAPGQSAVKPIQPGLCCGNRDKRGPLFLVQPRGSAHENTPRVYVRVAW
jgi:hypothetical protein